MRAWHVHKCALPPSLLPQVDRIFYAASLAANQARLPLAKMAVAETRMGVVEDKVGGQGPALLRCVGVTGAVEGARRGRGCMVQLARVHMSMRLVWQGVRAECCRLMPLHQHPGCCMP